jgi:GR25 family glycosyltransferase involved in LPS biosynthesis
MVDVYLINLSRRGDRLKSALSELGKVSAEVHIIDAVDAQIYFGKESVFISKAALVCSLSHEKALNEFLHSGQPYGIIVEDDLKVISSENFNNSINLALKYDIDLLQIGFLVKGFSDSIDFFIVNTTSTIIKLYNFFTKLLAFGELNRLRVKRNIGLPVNLVPDNFRAGAHCYLISRSFASELIKVVHASNNTFDGFLMSIALHRKFKVARYLRSAVSQFSTESDIKNRD